MVKLVILVVGQASASSSSEALQAPALLDMADATFSDNAKVFIREA